MSRPQGSNIGSVPVPHDAFTNRGYGSNASTGVNDFAQGNPNPVSPLSQSMNNAQGFDNYEITRRGSSIGEDGSAGLHRANSTASTAVPAPAPSRSNTLRKKSSVRRTSSLKRSSSKRSLKAGSIAGFAGVDADKDFYSAFSIPIPTQGTPTEILANRFQAWRQLLKSLIGYFREIQASYEMRAKATHKVQSVIANISHPAIFMSEHGLGEATRMLDAYHKRTIAEANKSREIENDVISALTGLRSDLGQKIKEIKSLSGDFKNSVEKEKDGTRREVEKLQEALRMAEHEDGSAVGKNDPFVVRLGVDRAIERQIDEENYLHRAYLNLESSGRELESIVVGEIQKAYNALAGILKREGDDAYNAVEALRTGPISMPKDAEWQTFVQNDPHFVDPSIPLRRIEDIEYPGKHHPAAAEVRSGMLERKSKYLKSYTPGWYVLSPTHLHEFKSADKIYTQPPVMSLYLPDQKLGSHSNPDGSSHKFMVKGKQSGSGVHKGHNWIFRAETYDTMMAWYEDMRILTEKTGEERDAYVRKHARSTSGNHSDRATISSDGMEEDEADEVPYSADAAALARATELEQPRPVRPTPGGRFPSELQVPRDRSVSMGQSSGSEDERDFAAIPAQYDSRGQNPYRLDGVSAGTTTTAGQDTDGASYFENTAAPPQHARAPAVVVAQQPVQQQQQQPFLGSRPADAQAPSAIQSTTDAQYIAPEVAAAVTAGAAGAAALVARKHQQESEPDVGTLDPAVPGKSEPRDTSVLVDNATAVDANKKTTQAEAAPYVPSATAPATSPAATESLGGHEAEGAHETSSFPRIVRHDTDISVSQLHVPGEYPRRA